MAEAETGAPAAVLDASALLAHLNDEKGATEVRKAMQAGAAISVANWIEVLSKLAERGEDPGVAAAEMRGAELVGQVIAIEPITDDDCIAIARLRPATKAQGLSLPIELASPWPSARHSGADDGWRVGEGQGQGRGANDPMIVVRQRCATLRQSDRKQPDSAGRDYA